jgi:lipopolysaccharide heptosyltransferase I
MADAAQRAAMPAPRLIAVRLSALGDVVHTLPAVAALRKSFSIDWAVESPYRELVEIVAEVRPLAVSLKRWSASKILAARRAIRGHEVAIDFQGLIKSALVARLSGAKTRYGFHRDFIREKPASWMLNRHVSVDPDTHVVDWNFALARAAAVDHGQKLQTVDDAALRAAFRAFAAGGVEADGSVVLLPGAGRPEKLWPIDRFRELAAGLGDRALAVWGPGEEERARAIGCRVAPPTNLRELARVLATADVVVGADTGPLHLAAALGTPVVGLYGPTSPRRNGPYGQLERCVSSFDRSRSMEAIDEASVQAQIAKIG